MTSGPMPSPAMTAMRWLTDSGSSGGDGGDFSGQRKTAHRGGRSRANAGGGVRLENDDDGVEAHGPSRMASRSDHVKQVTRWRARGVTGWPSMQGPRRHEQGGIITFLMGAIVVLVAVAVGGWWFLVRSDAAPRPTLEDTEVVAGGSLDGRWVVEAGNGSY